MIPKIIHYCWFGGSLKPKSVMRCIASWKKYLPDYEIIEWNEDKIGKYMNPYVGMCLREKKYAFLSDYIRLVVVYEYGGLYFDTDVEVVRSFDVLLKDDAFFGFETPEYINTGEGFGAVAHNKIVASMIEEYEPFIDGSHGVARCPMLNTAALLKHGMAQNGKKQKIDGAVIYPVEYFNPYDDPTGVLMKTENTYSVHWYSKSWLSKGKVMRSIVSKPLHRLQRIIEVLKRKHQSL